MGDPLKERRWGENFGDVKKGVQERTMRRKSGGSNVSEETTETIASKARKGTSRERTLKSEMKGEVVP